MPCLISQIKMVNFYYRIRIIYIIYTIHIFFYIMGLLYYSVCTRTMFYIKFRLTCTVLPKFLPCLVAHYIQGENIRSLIQNFDRILN